MKFIVYAYPTSDLATKLGKAKTGTWFVMVVKDDDDHKGCNYKAFDTI